MTSEQNTPQGIPCLSTVKNLPNFFPAAGITPAVARAHVFKSEDRKNSRGEIIKGNGLAAAGAIIRCGRKVLIDVDRYAAWLSSGAA
jgi:hypothetical protein